MVSRIWYPWCWIRFELTAALGYSRRAYYWCSTRCRWFPVPCDLVRWLKGDSLDVINLVHRCRAIYVADRWLVASLLLQGNTSELALAEKHFIYKSSGSLNSGSMVIPQFSLGVLFYEVSQIIVNDQCTIYTFIVDDL